MVRKNDCPKDLRASGRKVGRDAWRVSEKEARLCF